MPSKAIHQPPPTTVVLISYHLVIEFAKINNLCKFMAKTQPFFFNQNFKSFQTSIKWIEHQHCKSCQLQQQNTENALYNSAKLKMYKFMGENQSGFVQKWNKGCNQNDAIDYIHPFITNSVILRTITFVINTS